MYKIENFDSLEDLESYLNENSISRENIVKIFTVGLGIALIFVEE